MGRLFCDHLPPECERDPRSANVCWFFWEGEVRRIGRTATPLMTRSMSTPEVAGIISNGLSYVNGGRLDFDRGCDILDEKVTPPTVRVARNEDSRAWFFHLGRPGCQDSRIVPRWRGIPSQGLPACRVLA